MFLLLPYGIEEEAERRPYATWALIALNAAVFAAVLLMGEEGRQVAYLEHGFVPEDWWRWGTLLTYMFLHGGWLHIAANMFFLWVFGRLVEGRLGSMRFVVLYLVCGVLAAAAHAWSVTDFFSDEPCIGASGAVSGVLGAAMVLAPRARVRCFYVWMPMVRPLWGVVGIPSFVFLGGWLLGQLVFALTFSGLAAAVQVAYWAHVGGFAAGAVLAGGLGIPRALRRLVVASMRRRGLRRAFAAARREDWTEAAGVLENLRGEEALPEDAALLPARVYCAMGNKGKAASSAREEFRAAAAVKQRGRILDAWFLLGAAEARSQLDAHEYLVAARSLAELGRGREAASTLIEALERFPENRHADAMLFELGAIDGRTGEKERAGDVFDLLLRVFPDSQFAKSVKWRG